MNDLGKMSFRSTSLLRYFVMLHHLKLSQPHCCYAIYLPCPFLSITRQYCDKVVLLCEPFVVTVELVKKIKDLTLIVSYFYVNPDSLHWLLRCISTVWPGAGSVIPPLFPPSLWDAACLAWEVKLDSPTVFCSAVFTHSPGSQQHHCVNLFFPSKAFSILDLSPGMLLSSHLECNSVPKGELSFLMYLSTHGGISVNRNIKEH